MAHVQPPDPRDPNCATPESIAIAKRIAAEDRTLEDARRQDFMVKKERALNTLTALCDEFTYPVVQGWLNQVSRGYRP